MVPLSKDCSEPSALNINESEFGLNGESCVIIEREESYLANQLSFSRPGEFNRSINNQSEIIQEPINENSGFLNKTNVSAMRGKYYADNGFDQIDEENEISSSIFEYSKDDSKIKFKSNAKTPHKVETEEIEDPATIQQNYLFNNILNFKLIVSKFLNSVDDINEIQYEPSQVVERKISDICDFNQSHEKFSFHQKESAKNNENSFDLDLRKSITDKGKNSGIGEGFAAEVGMNAVLDIERKRSSIGSQKNNMQNSIRVGQTLNDNEKFIQLQSKLSNISRIESSTIGVENEARFTFQANKEILFNNAKETFDNVMNGTYISNLHGDSLRRSSHHGDRSSHKNINSIKEGFYLKAKSIMLPFEGNRIRNNMNSIYNIKKCECMHRKSPVEEFFYMLVNAMKLIHPQKEQVITCKAKTIYEAAMKRKNIQFYEFNNYCIKLKLKANKLKRKVAKINVSEMPDDRPEITKLVHPDQYEIIEGFFTNRRGRTSIGL